MWEGQIDETLSLYDEFKEDDLIKIFIAPHSPYTCSFETLKKVGEIARNYKLPIHIHIAETKDEVNIIREKYNKTPAEVCKDAGLYDENKVIAAHCVYLNDDDIIMVKNYDFSVVYNPQSNMKLASGAAPIVKMMENGINVALGTDGASSNNNLNMIDEMKSASLLQKLTFNDATALSAYDTLKLATVNAAKAIGMEDKLGKIKEGFLADIILIDFNKPHLNPPTDIYSNIVYAANGSEIKTVIINGKVVLKDYKLLDIKEDETILNANQSFIKVIERL
jgi:5-methylthioadenosine/S-adenosylhomocysteine deaminase